MSDHFAAFSFVDRITAFEAGWSFGETTEDFAVQYEVAPALMPSGTYRNITGNPALAFGLIAASVKSSGMKDMFGVPSADGDDKNAKDEPF